MKRSITKHRKQETEYRLIAEYVGDKDCVHDYRNPAMGFGWIMPVIEKIFLPTTDSHLSIGSGWCEITIEGYEFVNDEGLARIGYNKHYETGSTLNCIVDCVIEFITWDNKGK